MPTVNHRHPSPEPPEHTPLGVYVKTGSRGEPMQRTADTPAQAVALRFDGWQPQTATAAVEPAARAEPAPSSSAKTR